MPTLPQYNSKGRLTTQQPGVTRSGAGSGTRAIGKIFSTVADIAIRWKKAEEEMQNASLLARQTELSAQIHLDAEDDNDIQNGAKLKREELLKGTDALLGEVQNPLQRERLAIQMQHNAAINSIKLDNTYRKKKIREFQNVDVPKVVNGIMLQKAASPDHNSAIWKRADADLKGNVMGWQKEGLIDSTFAAELIAEERQMVVINEIVSDADTTLKNLKDKKWHPELTIQERQALIKKAEQQIVINEKVFEAQKEEVLAQQEAQWYAADGLGIQQYLGNQVSATDVQRLVETGRISPQVGKAIASNSWSKKAPRAKTDIKKYNSLLEKYYEVDDSDHEAVKEWRTDVMAAQSSGILKREDANEAKPTLKAKKSLIGQTLKDFGGLAKDVFKGDIAAVENRMAKSFFRNLTGLNITPENTEKAKETAIAEEQKRNNPNRGRYKLGDIIHTVAGARKVVGFDIDGEPMVVEAK